MRREAVIQMSTEHVFSESTWVCFKCHASVPFTFILFDIQRLLNLRPGLTWTH